MAWWQPTDQRTDDPPEDFDELISKITLVAHGLYIT